MQSLTCHSKPVSAVGTYTFEPQANFLPGGQSISALDRRHVFKTRPSLYRSGSEGLGINTVHASGTNSTTGAALVGIYAVP
jgi:hypothetical protein